MAVIKESTGDRIFNILNIALMTAVLIIVLYPLILILSASISDPDYVSSGEIWLYPRGITLEGYIRVFQDDEIMIGYRNTVFYTLFGTMLNLLLTLPAAYSLSKKNLKGRGGIMLFMTFTMFFGGGLIPTYLLMKQLNLIDTYWILPISGAVSAMYLIVSRTFFANGVPEELEEAAFIDGYSPIRTFIFIVLPLSKALIGVLALYYGVGHWNSYFSALIYLTDRTKIPLQLVLREILVQNQIQASMMAEGQIAGAEEMLIRQAKLAELIKYSVIIVSSLPVLMVYPFLQRYFNKGIMLGSLKG